jgi:PhnB protein
MGKVKAIPEGYHVVTPYLTVRGAAQAIEFYQKAFGATPSVVMPSPDGKIMHAEIRIGDSVVMLADENPQMGNNSPQTLGGATAGIMLYTENVDQAFERAVKAGATAQMPPADMFWGDRFGSLVDPFGHKWSMATHIRDVSPDEMKKAQKEWEQSMAAQQKGQPQPQPHKS